MNYSKKNRNPLVFLAIACLMVSLFTACGRSDPTAASGNTVSNEASSQEALSLNSKPEDGAPIDESTMKRGTMDMKDFSATTLDGGTFTNEDLAKYDLTMVNIWTTWCTSCIEEMPDLQELYAGMLPDNVNLITICGDASEESALAKEILEKLGCTIPTLIPDEKLIDSLMWEIRAWPTTIFVDSEGNMIGEEQIGAPESGGSIAEGYLDMIHERLAMAGAAQ